MPVLTITSSCYSIRLYEQSNTLWEYRLADSDTLITIEAPVFEIDGQACPAVLCEIRESQPAQLLRNGVMEYYYQGTFVCDAGLTLEMIFRVAEGNPVVRFRYMLKSVSPRTMTKCSGKDAIRYLGVSAADYDSVKEVQFSAFNEMVHSYCLLEEEIPARNFKHHCQAMGPMLVGQAHDYTMLVAYEHGSTVPDAFLTYQLAAPREISLQAVKGNYYSGQALSDTEPYQTIWFQLAAVTGDENVLAHTYRTFILRHLTFNQESRQPYIFYNTWAYQERNQAWNKKRYLDSMTQERILQEIEVAHRMGIDVFVLDTGWYEKTGDWRVNRQRFSDGLKTVKETLDRYGMKLGLWFSPTEVALTSDIHQQHRDCIMSWHGEASHPHPVWETEESQNICLVTRYRDAFADELIRLVKEVGVSYFKWDAIGQYGCDDPQHQHGNPQCSAEERADNYAFQLGQSMAYIVDRLCQACPEAIVDFDVTESGRCVGLGFLAAGKYFLINNGPYYGSFDVPAPADWWGNIFVYPGPARGWFCRVPLSIDKWIPSVLFLTHYLPDDPESSQLINIASLILGQNGIWGDLLNISEEGIQRFGVLLGLYKQVRDDITVSDPIFTGVVGGSPEIYEKINPDTSCGAVVMFASAAGEYRYVTSNSVNKNIWMTDGVTVVRDERGQAVITAPFNKPGAHIIYFGVETTEETLCP